MRLHPWQDVLDTADKAVKQGATVYQQFKCAHCGAKQTIDTPNSFHRTGSCEECGKLTNIEKNGHNFMLVMGGPI